MLGNDIPLGAHGTGEIDITGVATIFNTTTTRTRSLPITPDEVLAELTC